MELTNKINKQIFKSNDIRGIYPTDIDKNIAYTIGKSYGTYIKNNGYTKCITGYDNRKSSVELSVSLILGILSTGVDVLNLGLVTTPMCLFAKKLFECDCYIMVTASHNPKEYNGFKFSLDNTGNAKGEEIEKFRDFTLNGDFTDGIGRITSHNIKEQYKAMFKEKINLGQKRLKVVLDLANGTTSIIAREIYELFDLDLTIINEESDSNFPNHHPDPTVEKNQEQLSNKVRELNANIGIGFDGDGDRVGIVDNKGNIISADKFMAIACKTIIENNDDKRILYDVKCSRLLQDEIIKLGGTPILYRTGASHTMSKVIDDNILFGGEYSGHIFYNDRIPTIGSGLYAGLRMVELLSKTNETLDELLSKLSKYYSTEQIDFKVEETKKNEVMENIKNYCVKMRLNIDTTDGVKINFKDGWCLIRMSNTTPCITTRFEATSEERLYGIKKEFTNLVNYFNK